MAASAAWLPGHTDSVLCCEVLTERKLLASGGEDGTICLSDLSTLKPVGRIDAGRDGCAAVPALCSHPAQEAGLFAAAGPAVLQLDLRAGLGPEAVCRTFQVNADEVNGLAATATNGGWLAAADDAGEVAVVCLAPAAGSAGDTAPPETGAAAGAAARPPQYKTLRRGHTNIASAVAFRPHRPWELLSGGLDSTVVKWDFSRLRPVQSWSLAGEATASGGQLFNPPMVHSIAVPQTDDRSLCRLMALARGDGGISIHDADFKPPAAAAGSDGKKGGGKARQQQRQRQQAALGVPGRLALLGQEQGGHAAAVNCVTFLAGSSWQQLLSASNDCRLLLWHWQAAIAAAEEAAAAAGEAAAAGGPRTGSSLRQGGAQAAAGASQASAAGAAGGGGGGNEGGTPLLAAEHRHPRKINWTCSADLPGCGYNAFVADTGRRITALALC